MSSAGEARPPGAGGPPGGWTPAEAGAMRALLRRKPGLGALRPDDGLRLWSLYGDAVRHAAGRTARRAGALGLVWRAFWQLYRPPGPARGSLGRVLVIGIPRAVRAEWRAVLAAAAVYGAVALTAGVAAAHSARWAGVLVPAALHGSRRGGGLQPGPGLVLALYFHNVSASALAYAGGVLAGVGTLAALSANAMLLGGLAGWAAAHGQSGVFWPLIAPHAVFELPATFCAGGAGLAMGVAWLHPGEHSRADALFAAFRRTAPLFGACVAWLAAAALVEGLFTPSPLPGPWKLAGAAVLLAAFTAYLGWPRPSGASAAASPAVLEAPAAILPRVPASRVRPLTGSASPGARRRGSEPELCARLPEGLLLRLQPAAVPSRALALLVDTLVLAGIAIAVVVGAAAAGVRLSSMGGGAVAAAFGMLYLGLYGFLFEWLGQGATPGKRLLGLRALRMDARPLGATDALIRNVMRVIDFLPAAYLVGLITALSGGGHRRLGDIAADTVVVHVPPDESGGRRRAGVGPPMPRVRSCGALPEPATVRRLLPARLQKAALGAWRAQVPQSAPAVRAVQEAAERLTLSGLLHAPAAEALEHLAAAVDRAHGERPVRWLAAAPRDRSADLAPRAPGAAAAGRIPEALSGRILAYWTRRTALTPARRSAVAASLAAEAASALRAAGLDRPDPDALVEHLAFVMGRWALGG